MLDQFNATDNADKNDDYQVDEGNIIQEERSSQGQSSVSGGSIADHVHGVKK